MSLKKLLKREKTPFDELPVHSCPNCGQEFKGYYCPNCGQSTTEFDLPAGFVFYDFLGNFISFDSRFFKTFLDLMIRPGFLTTEFFKGRRARYAPPFRVFIFLSFLLFLFLQVATNHGLNQALDKSLQSDLTAAKDSIAEQKTDSLAFLVSVADKDSSKTVDLDFDLTSLFQGKNLRESLEMASAQLEERLKTATDPEQRKALISLINITRSPEQLVSRILKYLSWAFFILLPIFALLLKLFYMRRKVYYIRHLVFSVHLHSFLFLILTVVVIFNLLFPGKIGFFSLWLLLLVPVYIYLAMRNFYQQGYPKTFVKFFLVGAVYHLILLSAFGYVLIKALEVI